MGTADQKEQQYFALDSAGESQATRDWAKEQREKAATSPKAAEGHQDGHKH